MRQKLLTFKLALKLAIMFFQDFYQESIKEIKDKNLYPQEKYSDCEHRAMAIIKGSLERVIRVYSYAICYHRYNQHNEAARKDELQNLSRSMNAKEIKTAESWFWLS